MPTLVDKKDTGETAQKKNNYAATIPSPTENRAPSEREANLLLNLAQTAAKLTTESNSSNMRVVPKIAVQSPFLIRTPLNHDILSGRGQRAHNHSGNVIYRRFINEERRSYVNGNPREKKMLITKLLTRIKNMSPPGRFLKGRPGLGTWEILPDDEARKKTAQALRENAVNIRKIYLPDQPKSKGSVPKSKMNLLPSVQINTQPLSKLPSAQEGTFLYHNDKKRKALDVESSTAIKPETKRKAYTDALKQTQGGVSPFPIPRNKVLYQRANIHPLSYNTSNAQMPIRRDGGMIFVPPKNHVPLRYPSIAASYHQKVHMLPPHPSTMNQSTHNDDSKRTQLAPRNATRMRSDPPGSHCDEIRNG